MMWTKGADLSGELEAYLLEHTDTKAVIIDVLEKIRTSKSGSQSEYSHDYLEIGALQKIANRHKIAMIAVTHCKKGRESDWINEICGGAGVTGAADTILLLRKLGQKNPNGKLFITGRDVPGNEFDVKLDAKTLQWNYAGTSEELMLKKDLEMYNASPVARTIRMLLEKNDGNWAGTSSELMECGLKELGEPIAKNVSALGRILNKLDGMFQQDSIIHTKPDPNGGTKGRVHQFRIEKPSQQEQQTGQPNTPIPMETVHEDGAQALPEEPQPYELPF